MNYSFIKNIIASFIMITSIAIAGCAETYNSGGTVGGEFNMDDTDIPPVYLDEPPELIVIPETYVYAVPDLDYDLFFYSGWWWIPWKSNWYRSQNYSTGWTLYHQVPMFYRTIPSRWRDYYQTHNWRGYHWDYMRLYHYDVIRNWSYWERNRYWENNNYWGIRHYKPDTHLMIDEDSRDHDTYHRRSHERYRKNRRDKIDSVELPNTVQQPSDSNFVPGIVEKPDPVETVEPVQQPNSLKQPSSVEIHRSNRSDNIQNGDSNLNQQREFKPNIFDPLDKQ